MKQGAWLMGATTIAVAGALAFLPRDLAGPGIARHFEAAGKGAPLIAAVIGTSLTAGKKWPGGLAHAIAQCSGKGVALDTLAKPGAASSWGRVWTERLYARRNDLLVIEFAINDADVRRGVWPNDAARNVRIMVHAARKANPAVRIILLIPHRPTGVKRWLVRPLLDLHYQKARHMAARLRIILIDLSGARITLPDGTHPSDADFAALANAALVNASHFCAAPKPSPVRR